MIDGALMPATMDGMIEAPATRGVPMPWTRSGGRPRTRLATLPGPL
jgi:hypothetical protein